MKVHSILYRLNYMFIGNYRPGAAGRSLEGVEIKIDKPDSKGDGEICFRGRHVFMGYLYQPEKTVEAVDEDGWLHSGDIGRIDSEGKIQFLAFVCTVLLYIFLQYLLLGPLLYYIKFHN